MIKNLPTNAVQSMGGCENHLEKGMQPTSVFLPGKSHRQKSLVGYSPWGHKESNTTEQLSTAVGSMSEELLGRTFPNSFSREFLMEGGERE